MLKMELASVFDVGVHFVKATYRLEGDGVLVLNCYEEIFKLRSAIQTGYYPNVQAITRQAYPGNAALQQQSITYAIGCVQPGLDYFQDKLGKDAQNPVACLIDASKAFDLVDHCVLFKKLLERNMPKPLVRLLLRWYKTQHLCVRWMGKSSEYFQVSNGVRQGGVLSPILFTIYMDSLFESLSACGRGCYWKDHFSGALC